MVKKAKAKKSIRKSARLSARKVSARKKLARKIQYPKEFQDYELFNSLVAYILSHPQSPEEGRQDIINLILLSDLPDDAKQLKDVDLVKCIRIAEQFYAERFTSFIPMLKIQMEGFKRNGRHKTDAMLDAEMWEETTMSKRHFNQWVRKPIDAGIFFESKKIFDESYFFTRECYAMVPDLNYTPSYLSYVFDTIRHEITHVLHTHLRNFSLNGKEYTYRPYGAINLDHDFMFWTINKAISGKEIYESLIHYYVEPYNYELYYQKYDPQKIERDIISSNKKGYFDRETKESQKWLFHGKKAYNFYTEGLEMEKYLVYKVQQLIGPLFTGYY